MIPTAQTAILPILTYMLMEGRGTESLVNIFLIRIATKEATTNVTAKINSAVIIAAIKMLSVKELIQAKK